MQSFKRLAISRAALCGSCRIRLMMVMMMMMIFQDLLKLTTSRAGLGGSWSYTFAADGIAPAGNLLLSSVSRLLRHAGEHSGSILVTTTGENTSNASRNPERTNTSENKEKCDRRRRTFRRAVEILRLFSVFDGAISSGNGREMKIKIKKRHVAIADFENCNPALMSMADVSLLHVCRPI